MKIYQFLNLANSVSSIFFMPQENIKIQASRSGLFSSNVDTCMNFLGLL